MLVPSPETSITRRLVSMALSANSAKEKSIAAPIAVRPRNERGAALIAAAKARASAGIADHRPVDHHPLFAVAGPFDVSERNRAVRPGRDCIEELLALDRVRIAAPLERELVVVDAAGDIRGEHDRGVDGDRGARRARPGAWATTSESTSAAQSARLIRKPLRIKASSRPAEQAYGDAIRAGKGRAHSL